MSDLHDQLAGLVNGYWYTQAIYVVAKLDIAGHLKDCSRSCQELAQGYGQLDPGRLRQ